MSAEDKDREDGTPVLTEAVGPDDARDVPVLQDAVTRASGGLSETELAAIQAELASVTHELTERLLHTALLEMEAALFQQVSDRLREELPGLVERVLRDHLEMRR